MALLKRRTRPKKEKPLAERELLPARPRESDEERKAYKEKFAAARRDARERLVDGRPVIWARPSKPTSVKKAALRRLEREEEICSKRPEDLTPAEWEYERKLMARVILEHPQGRKEKTEYLNWEYAIARAKVMGLKPPRLQDLAGFKGAATGEHDEKFDSTAQKDAVDILRDLFKKARKRRQLPAPPKR